MPATKQAEHWIATVDERRARLFRCTRNPGQEWTLEELAALRSVWEEDHERHRPAVLQRGPGTAPPHEAGFGHEEDEEHRRFARDVARWLERSIPGTGAQRFVVFAAPRFLGPLKDTLSVSMSKRATIVEKELSRFRADQLAGHPAVLAALNPA